MSQEELEQQLSNFDSEDDDVNNENDYTGDNSELFTPISDLEQQTPLNLLYLPRVAQFLLIWIFGIKAVLMAVAGYGAYNTPNVKSIGAFLAVVYGGLFGVWQLMLLLLGFAILKLMEKWEQVKLLGNLFLMSNKFAQRVNMWGKNLINTITSKYAIMSDTFYQSQIITKSLESKNKALNNTFFRQLLIAIDSLIGKLIDLMSSFLSKLSSLITLPSLTSSNLSTVTKNDELENNAKEQTTSSENIHLVETDSSSNSENGESQIPFAQSNNKFSVNSSELENDAIKSIQSLLSDFPSNALDLSNLPEPPKNATEMKQQMDMMINLMQQTQKLAEMSEKFNKPSKRRNKHF
jgi:hypothetical protein